MNVRIRLTCNGLSPSCGHWCLFCAALHQVKILGHTRICHLSHCCVCCWKTDLRNEYLHPHAADLWLFFSYFSNDGLRNRLTFEYSVLTNLFCSHSRTNYIKWHVKLIQLEEKLTHTSRHCHISIICRQKAKHITTLHVMSVGSLQDSKMSK